MIWLIFSSGPFWTALIVAQAIVCAILEYGFVFAYFQREFPTLAYAERKTDSRFALLSAGFCLTGGLPMLVVQLEYLKHGLKFR